RRGASHESRPGNPARYRSPGLDRRRPVDLRGARHRPCPRRDEDAEKRVDRYVVRVFDLSGGEAARPPGVPPRRLEWRQWSAQTVPPPPLREYPAADGPGCRSRPAWHRYAHLAVG